MATVRGLRRLAAAFWLAASPGAAQAVAVQVKPIRLVGKPHLIRALRAMDYAVGSVIWDPADITPRHSYMPDFGDGSRFLPIPESVLTPYANANLTFLINNADAGPPRSEPEPNRVAQADAWAVMDVANAILGRFDPDRFSQDPEAQQAALRALWDELGERGFIEAVPGEGPPVSPAQDESSQSAGPRRQRKERQTEKLWRKVESVGRQKGLEGISLKFGDFAHVDSGKPVQGTRLPRIPARIFRDLARGRQVLTLELPPRAVASFWQGRDKQGPASAVAERSSFWEKAMSAAPPSPRQNIFGVDADSSLRHITHRLWLHFMGHGIMDQTPGVEFNEDAARAGLANISAERRRELDEDGVTWLKADENPLAREGATLYRRPHPSWDRVYAGLRPKYGPLFESLGFSSDDLNEAVTMYLTLAIATLRDFMQARMMAEHLYRFIRDAAPGELPADKVLRVLHVGGAAHHLSLDSRLRSTGLFDRPDSLLRMETPFLDPRIAEANLIGSSALTRLAPELLDRIDRDSGDVGVDADFIAGYFGIFLERHGDLAYEQAAWKRFERLTREGRLNEAEDFLRHLAAASTSFRDGGLYGFLTQGPPGRASEASRRRFVLSRLAMARGRPLTYARHHSILILRNALSFRGVRELLVLILSLAAYAALRFTSWHWRGNLDQGRQNLASRRLGQAARLIDDGRQAEGETLIQESLALDPSNAEALKLLDALSNPHARRMRAESEVFAREANLLAALKKIIDRSAGTT